MGVNGNGRQIPPTKFGQTYVLRVLVLNSKGLVEVDLRETET